LVIKKGLSFRPGRAQNGSADENMVSASATTTKRRLRDADSYACETAKKYLIQEKNRMGRFEFPQKYRPMDIQGLLAKVFTLDIFRVNRANPHS
jgi:hypothetical protein